MRTIELPVTMEWTPEMLESLPRDYRYEVSEGNLIVSAAAMRAWHSDAEFRITQLLRSKGLHAFHEIGVVIGRGEIYDCDVGVLRDLPSLRLTYYPARDYDLVVEVVSPDSRTADRVNKPAKYAAANIPEYWRVEEADDGEAVVHLHRLVREEGGTRYAETRVVMLSTLEKERL